jgi:hypothetical protein
MFASLVIRVWHRSAQPPARAVIVEAWEGDSSWYWSVQHLQEKKGYSNLRVECSKASYDTSPGSQATSFIKPGQMQSPAGA